MFQFNDYMQICREQQGLTQGELTEALIRYNQNFESLDTTTLSRWERGASKPSLSKQTLIVQYFSDTFNTIYPFIEQAEPIEIEKSFCALGFSKLFGRHKLVMAFPCHHMDMSRFLIKRFQDSPLQQSALRKNLLILQEMYNLELSVSHLEALANTKSSLFLVCEYDYEYYGHLFILKLKPKYFEALMRFELFLDQIQENHLATHNEMGSYLFFGFFGMSDIILSMLWVHFYAHVIKEQNTVVEMAAIVTSKEGEMIAHNMNTESYESIEKGKKTFQSFRATPKQMLITDNVVKMLFNPESCPEL